MAADKTTTMVLVIDNLSPFTPEILKCLDRVASGGDDDGGSGSGGGGRIVQYAYRKHFEFTAQDLEKCDKVILSGRRRNDPAINAANSRIIRYCHDTGKPLLGICYGAEIIALTLGGSIKKMPRSVQGPIEIAAAPNALTGDKARLSVYESHGFCVARLPPEFERLASSQYCEYEMFAHREKKIFGTQFHPEKSGQDGQDLIASFATRV